MKLNTYLLSLFLSFTFCFILVTDSGSAPRVDQVDNSYNYIKNSFENEKWQEVLEKGERFRQDNKRSKWESSIIFLMAQSALKLSDINRAFIEAERLRLKFPNSDYNDDARWIMAEIALMSENWEKAQNHLRWIIGFSNDQRLKKTAQIRLEELKNFLSQLQKSNDDSGSFESNQAQIALLLPFSTSLKEKAEDFSLGFQIRWEADGAGKFKVYDTKGDPVRAVRLARQLAMDNTVSAFVGGFDPPESAALAAVAEADDIPFLTTVCGVEGVTAIGRNVFQGRVDFGSMGKALAQKAVGMFDGGSYGILVPQSQEGEQIATGFKLALEEAGGEILAEEVYYTDTEDLKSYFHRIRAIGLRKAYDDSLRAFYETNGWIRTDTLYVYDSRDSDERNWSYVEMDSTFEIGFKLPGHLFMPVDAEPTIDGLTDIDELISDSFILSLVSDSLDNALSTDTVWTLTDEFLDSLWISEHKRIREWMIETEQEIDSLEIPLYVFDGFLLVIEPDQIEMVAPQFARANLRTQLFGGEFWADHEALQKVRSYVDGIIFAEPMAISGGEDYYDFAATVSGDSSKIVSRYHLAGERAAKMLAFASMNAQTPSDLRLALSQIRDLETLSGKVSLLKEERINRYLGLFRFYRGNFEELPK
ncbi:MAG: tetratricopeptide repeat protein [Calditrichaeota bacterium]|nr:tetratricopeptide repeat protein [Calditrichota bacterium]